MASSSKMWLSIVGLWILYAGQVAATTTTCNHDNCLRAVIATAFPSVSGSADCASYFLTTVVTDTIAHTTQVIAPTNIPTYASACSGSVRYSSACSCVSATASTTTVTASNGCNNPGVCGTYVIIDSPSCGPVGDCTCVTDTSGNSVCVEDVFCNSAVQCASNSDCVSGEVCWTSNCCGFNICATPSNICLNPAKKLMLRKPVAEVAEKREGECHLAGKCA